MKRCPECEFLYEDEQYLCDMDGKQLMPDRSVFPTEALVPSDYGVLAHSHRPKIWVWSSIGTLLISSFMMSYYYLSNRAVHHASMPASQSIVAPATANRPVTQSQADSQVDSAESKDSTRDSVSRDDRATSDPTPIEKTAAVAKNANPEANKAPPSNARKPVKKAKQANQDSAAASSPEEAKKQSKVESFIKKAGRILKKPFKL
jgi:hypothetical protein